MTVGDLKQELEKFDNYVEVRLEDWNWLAAEPGILDRVRLKGGVVILDNSCNDDLHRGEAE